MGTVLQMLGKRREAMFHLESARTEALEANNSFAYLIAQGGFIYQAYLDGDIEQALQNLDGQGNFGGNEGYTRLYTPPHFFEMIAEIEAAGYPPHPRINFNNELSWIEKAPNIHTKGAAYRLLAKKGMEEGEDNSNILKYLKNSEQFITESGDPVELAKTWIEMARFNILIHKLPKARDLARKAYKVLSRYNIEVFPDDLKSLLNTLDKDSQSKDDYIEFLYQMMRIFEYRDHGENTNQILARILKYACRMFLSERGAVFSNESKGAKKDFILLAGYNFTELDMNHADFAASRKVLEKAFKTKKPVVRRFHMKGDLFDYIPIRSAACLPMVKEGRVKGCFYFDNLYLDNRFELLDECLMEQAARFMGDHIEQVMEYYKLKRETSIWSSSQSSHTAKLQREEFVFQSQIMARLLAEVKQMAQTDTTILIQGETGVGKEILARQIHFMSHRNSGPFEVVDLTAIPETLLESELFGYEKGAFTGADHQKRGRFELTGKGTLFLDEIGEIPLSFQVKLLRVLQEKTFVRVGGTKTLKSNFRLIAATNRDLEKEVASGGFRQDLFYRLNMMPITVPPLREREVDIVVLARHFLTQYALKHNKPSLRLTAEDIALLTGYPWPGNIRELKNVMERAVLLSKSQRLDFSQLSGGPAQRYPDAINPGLEDEIDSGEFFEGLPTMEELERRYIQDILKKTKGKIGGTGGAGEILGVKRTTLYGRMKKLGIKIQR